SVTASRNYRIYVSDSNRCAGYESAIITMYDLPVTTLTVTTVACKNDTVYLDGNTISGKAPFHYAWSGIDTAMNIPVKMDATRVFNLRVIDDNNCRYFDSVKVTVYPIDFIPLRDTVVCPGGATVKLKPSVKALPPVNIQWLNTGTYDDSLMVTPHKDSMFVAQLSDGLACNIFDTVEIKVDTIVLSAPDDYICKGDMYTVKPLINARYPYTITWNGVPGTDSLTFKADSTTKFIINIEDIHNCKAVDTVTVINWLSPQALAGSDRNVCHDILQHIKVLPVLGTPPYKILWNNGLTVDSFATYYTSPQVLTVKITDANGCEAFDTVNIQVKPQSQATITPLAPVCETEPEKLLVAFPMGGAWAGPGVSNSRFRPSVAGPGKHPLVYTFTSPYGCPEKDTLVMIVKQLPIPNFYADKTTALPGTTINFTNVTLADTTYTSKWEMGEPAAPGNTISTKDAAYTYNKLGKYIVRLTVNNGLCAPVIAEKNNYIFITDSIVSVPGINNSPFKIYPNPASDRVFIEGATIENVEVFDLQGRRLSCFIIPQDNEVQVAISDLPAGIYYLKIKSGENNYHEKVMIVN
ncbi:MAG TPA: T9SS type A sorting domain-containing protein, partial [Bacteroidia bacterium]|nr:T9SS type A sorting domain-containing protein [Bacteroidia bacterium]